MHEYISEISAQIKGKLKMFFLPRARYRGGEVGQEVVVLLFLLQTLLFLIL